MERFPDLQNRLFYLCQPGFKIVAIERSRVRAFWLQTTRAFERISIWTVGTGALSDSAGQSALCVPSRVQRRCSRTYKGMSVLPFDNSSVRTNDLTKLELLRSPDLQDRLFYVWHLVLRSLSSNGPWSNGCERRKWGRELHHSVLFRDDRAVPRPRLGTGRRDGRATRLDDPGDAAGVGRGPGRPLGSAAN
jgi:hypothetical protein